ncbi:hypothetical protein [Arthrobacter ginkgonis]
MATLAMQRDADGACRALAEHIERATELLLEGQKLAEQQRVSTTSSAG